ncbi:hypothetical protein [Xanthomonas campestris]|uniref:hypothetical protein n=1 Tax=Xanthomonas cannabis TaxID=1885674 RepID=UPI001E6512C2|nr:hypothetical protein [Xanthomonas campestris pv. zinniae]
MGIDHSEQFKELCANYGASMYFAQVLEHGIANALMFLDLIPRTSSKYTPEEHDAFFEGQFAKTLGNLIRALKSVAVLPNDLENALVQSKERRSYLAHYFFREAVDDVHLGRYDKLLLELEEHRSFFQNTDAKLQEFVTPVMLRYGFTEKILSRAMQAYSEHLDNGP